jgi:MFS superfamily sulfate permease-like transporter
MEEYTKLKIAAVLTICIGLVQIAIGLWRLKIAYATEAYEESD